MAGLLGAKAKRGPTDDLELVQMPFIIAQN